MKVWLRLALILVTVGGGFCGFAATWQALLTSQNLQTQNIALLVTFLALYAFVVASGLFFAQNERRIALLIVSFAMQIPWVSSPIISYRFTAAFHVTVGFVGGRLGGGFNLGSDWQCALFQKAPWGFGLNLFALIMLVLLIRIHVNSTRQLKIP